jgi:hypothetical protein
MGCPDVPGIAQTGAAALIETRRLGLSRMLAASTFPGTVITGETLGKVLIALIQALVILAGSALLFGVVIVPRAPSRRAAGRTGRADQVADGHGVPGADGGVIAGRDHQARLQVSRCAPVSSAAGVETATARR